MLCAADHAAIAAAKTDFLRCRHIPCNGVWTFGYPASAGSGRHLAPWGVQIPVVQGWERCLGAGAAILEARLVPLPQCGAYVRLLPKRRTPAASDWPVRGLHEEQAWDRIMSCFESTVSL